VAGDKFALEVKLVDFDTVVPFSPEAADRPERDVLGTDQYIAPEAYEGRYTPASDIFAVGVLTYWLLAGHPPFEPEIFDDSAGENRVGSPKMQEVAGRLRDARPCWQDAAAAARRLLQTMLAVPPHRRPSAKEALAHPWLAAAPAPMPVLAAAGMGLGMGPGWATAAQAALRAAVQGGPQAVMS